MVARVLQAFNFLELQHKYLRLPTPEYYENNYQMSGNEWEPLRIFIYYKIPTLIYFF